jgi:hypothetical protein
MLADFLINEKGYIVKAHYGKDLSDNMPWKQIYAFAGIKSDPPMGAPVSAEMER